MADNQEQKQIIQGQGDHDPQEHGLPAIGNLLVGKKFGGRGYRDGNLNRALGLHTNPGGDRLGIGRHQKDEIAVHNWPAVERPGIPGVMGFDNPAIQFPIHRHFIEQGITHFQNPVGGLRRYPYLQPEFVVTESPVQGLACGNRLPLVRSEGADRLDIPGPLRYRQPLEGYRLGMGSSEGQAQQQGKEYACSAGNAPVHSCL